VFGLIALSITSSAVAIYRWVKPGRGEKPELAPAHSR
jgi:hypothetical protein